MLCDDKLSKYDFKEYKVKNLKNLLDQINKEICGLSTLQDILEDCTNLNSSHYYDDYEIKDFVKNNDKFNEYLEMKKFMRDSICEALEQVKPRYTVKELLDACKSGKDDTPGHLKDFKCQMLEIINDCIGKASSGPIMWHIRRKVMSEYNNKIIAVTEKEYNELVAILDELEKTIKWGDDE